MFFMMSVFLRAQIGVLPEQKNKSLSDNCLSHPKSLYNSKEVEDIFRKHLGITTSQSKDFFIYAAKYGYLKMDEEFQLVKNGSITKDNAKQYWLNKLPYLENLYTYKYLPAIEQEKAEIKKKEEILLNESNKTASSSCNNLDFSAGNLSNWTGQWNNQGCPNQGTWTAYGNLTINGLNSSPTGFNKMGYVHELCNGGSDPLVPISRVAPGHAYSLRLGNDSAYQEEAAFSNGGTNGVFPYNHQTISNTFSVTAATQTITYWYAVVLDQGISTQHLPPDQPFFRIRMSDGTGAEISCASYSVDVTDAISIGGFDSLTLVNPGAPTDPTQSFKAYYKNWTPILIPLTPYLGQNVTITFESIDCDRGGHFGYAYLTVDCAPLAIITAPPQPCVGGNTVLSAPQGLATYGWTGPGIVGSSTSQTVTANVGGTYSVTMTTFANTGEVGCTLTLTTNIANSTLSPTASFSATSVCPTKNTQFTDESTLAPNQGTLTMWSWDFGDGTTSTSNNPTHIYNTPGSYPVNYTITSSVNCKATYSLMVTVNPVPTSSFSAAPVCQGAITTFINNSVGGSSYNWNFGDGSGTSTGQSPVYIYASPKVYAVTLTVTNTYSCNATSTNTVVVNAYPTATFSAPAVCLGTITTFSNSSSPTTGLSYSWNFNDGANPADTSNLQNPTYTYPSATTYTAVLTVTSADGCSASDTHTLSINPIPQVSVTSPSIFCGNAAVPTPTLISNPNNPNITYTWTNNDTLIGLAAAGINSPPIFTSGVNNTQSNINGVISITPSLNGCTGPPASYTITIKPTPVVLHGNLNYCPGDVVPAIQFTSTPVGMPIIATWSNTTSGNFIGISSTNGVDSIPTFTSISPVTVATSNIISLQGNLNGCTGPISKFSITINANPTAKFTYSSACDGNKTNFKDESIPNSGYISLWDWNFGNGDISFSQNPTELLTLGPHTVTLTVQTNVGCKNSVAETVFVNPSPKVSFTADTSGCTPFSTTFLSIDSTSQKISSWTWNFGNNKTATYSVQTSPSQTYSNSSHTQSSYYTVSLSVVSDSNCISTVTKKNYIIVYPKPFPAFYWGPTTADIIGPTIQFYNQSIGASGIHAYNWNFGDIYTTADSLNHSKILNPIHKYNDQVPYDYTATLVVENSYGCIDSVKEIIVIHDAVTFYIPNAFSPNGDSKNEGFKGTGIGINSATYQMWIYDRWGLMIFHSTGLESSWDGHVHDGPAEQDVYVWKVSFEDDMTRFHNYNGTVTLIK